MLPFVLLVPDMLLNFAQRTFFPSPADTLMYHYEYGMGKEDEKKLL